MLQVLLLAIVVVMVSVLILMFRHSRAFHKDKVIHGDLGFSGEADTLVVLLHAFSMDHRAMLSIQAEMEAFYGAGRLDFYTPDLPLRTFSVVPTSRMCAELVAAVDERRVGVPDARHHAG